MGMFYVESEAGVFCIKAASSGVPLDLSINYTSFIFPEVCGGTDLIIMMADFILHYNVSTIVLWFAVQTCDNISVS